MYYKAIFLCYVYRLLMGSNHINLFPFFNYKILTLSVLFSQSVCTRSCGLMCILHHPDSILLLYFTFDDMELHPLLYMIS